MGSEPGDGVPRPTNVTETLVANGGIVSDAFRASSTTRVGWSADRAVTALYSLRDLPERQREAIVLRYYADLSEAEIATAMGISRGAVKSHTARGMSALRA